MLYKDHRGELNRCKLQVPGTLARIFQRSLSTTWQGEPIRDPCHQQPSILLYRNESDCCSEERQLSRTFLEMTNKIATEFKKELLNLTRNLQLRGELKSC